MPATTKKVGAYGIEIDPTKRYRPREPFSGTLWEDGEVDVPDLNEQGGRQWNDDGSVKTRKEFQVGDDQAHTGVAIPVTLNPADGPFPGNHEFVQKWPQHFREDA